MKDVGGESHTEHGKSVKNRADNHRRSSTNALHQDASGKVANDCHRNDERSEGIRKRKRLYINCKCRSDDALSEGE